MELSKLFIKLSFIIIAAGFVIMSCKQNNEKNDKRYDMLNSGLVNSNKYIELEHSILYHRIESDFSEPTMSNIASHWLPKAKSVKEKSETLIYYIDSLRQIIAINETHTLSRTESHELFKAMKLFVQESFGIDSEFIKVFSKDSIFTFLAPDSLNENQFYDLYISESSNSAVVVFLNRIENNVRLSENKLISYCGSQYCKLKIVYDLYNALVTQNTKIAKKGDDIEVYAGLGAFTKSGSPNVFINGKEIQLNASGVASYKFKATQEPGTYKILVTVSYTDEMKIKKSKNSSITYKIIE